MIKRSVSRCIFLLLMLIVTASLIAVGQQPVHNERADADIKEVEFDISATPNPFEEFTVISVSTSETVTGSLIIRDRNNHVVSNLYEGNFRKGLNQFTWNGTNNAGQPMGHGRYFLEISFGERYTSRTIILILK